MSKRRNSGEAKPKEQSTNVWVWAVAIILMIVLILSAIIIPNLGSDNASSVTSPSDIRLDILYLHGAIGKGTILQPHAPGDDKNNVTLLNHTSERKFGQNILDRKYNPEIKPAVNIYVGSADTAGMVLNFKIEIYMFEGNSLATEPVATALFANYTTKGSKLPELVELKSTKYEGTPQDVTGVGGFGASIRLTIWRSDNIEDVDLRVYTGADDKISWIQIPYDRSLSSTQKNEDESTPMGSGALVVVAISAYSIIFYLRKRRCG